MALRGIEKEIEGTLYTANEYGYKHQRENAKLDTHQIEYLKAEHGLKTEHTDPETKEQFKIHNMCLNCQARHILKYRTTVNPTPFSSVRCNFVRGELPTGSSKLLRDLIAEGNIDERIAKLVIQSTVDPASWAELMFGFNDDNPDWKLRWYQKEQLRCTASRLTIREGRRSGKSFAVALKLLGHAYNTKIIASYDHTGKPSYRGPKIVIVTPFQSQLTIIFDEMEKLLKRNPELESQVIRTKGSALYAKQPVYRMSFGPKDETYISGATIVGYVSGSNIKSDGSSGGSLRGDSPDILYLDEMDMIPEEIINKAIKPFILSNANVKEYVTSTPIGKGAKGEFFKYCKDDNSWVEFYLPSTVLPHWDVVKSELEHEGVTSDAFKSEYMAEFVESGHGVFRLEFILKSIQQYNYTMSSPDNTDWWRQVAHVKDFSAMTKIIGIDWNKIAGTEMVVVAYDPSQHRWIVCDAINIASSEFSTVRYKEALIELNYKWKPDFVYPDQGYGHHIIEDLRYEAKRLRSKQPLTAVEAATMRLYDIMKPINFSSKITIRDPSSGIKREKYAKDLLIQNAVSIFEEGNIWLPESDRVLYNQLAQYQILKLGQNSKPIYGPADEKIGDHRLDALMLALLGMFLEIHPLYAQVGTPSSAPTVLTKEQLEARQNVEEVHDGFSALMKTMKKMGAGTYLEGTSFNRPGDDDDEALRKQWSKAQSKTRHRSRVLDNANPDSAYDTIFPEAMETSAYKSEGEVIPKGPPTISHVEAKGFRRGNHPKRGGRF